MYELPLLFPSIECSIYMYIFHCSINILRFLSHKADLHVQTLCPKKNFGSKKKLGLKKIHVQQNIESKKNHNEKLNVQRKKIFIMKKLMVEKKIHNENSMSE